MTTSEAAFGRPLCFRHKDSKLFLTSRANARRPSQQKSPIAGALVCSSVGPRLGGQRSKLIFLDRASTVKRSVWSDAALRIGKFWPTLDATPSSWSDGPAFHSVVRG